MRGIVPLGVPEICSTNFIVFVSPSNQTTRQTGPDWVALFPTQIILAPHARSHYLPRALFTLH